MMDLVAEAETVHHAPQLIPGARLIRRRDCMSPLRYPGSKRKMLPSILQLIQANAPRPELFVEPFCGGASIALGLLEQDAVERVLLGDFDPLVAAFWKEATENGPRLIQDMMREPVTVERWDFWRRTQPRSTRRRALKCLFLNRTTFSGIIGGNAGPIGGRAQESEYDIGCRFPKEALERRILNVYQLARAGRILRVHEGRWQESLRLTKMTAAEFDASATLLYLDPPYVEKAERLYERPFQDFDHRQLARELIDGTDWPWILSYDAEPLVLDRYRKGSGVTEYRVTHHYTMRGRKRDKPVPGREVIFTNLPVNPVSNELASNTEVEGESR
jgi:DNA adenine methylase